MSQFGKEHFETLVVDAMGMDRGALEALEEDIMGLTVNGDKDVEVEKGAEMADDKRLVGAEPRRWLRQDRQDHYDEMISKIYGGGDALGDASTEAAAAESNELLEPAPSVDHCDVPAEEQPPMLFSSTEQSGELQDSQEASSSVQIPSHPVSNEADVEQFYACCVLEPTSPKKQRKKNRTSQKPRHHDVAAPEASADAAPWAKSMHARCSFQDLIHEEEQKSSKIPSKSSPYVGGISAVEAAAGLGNLSGLIKSPSRNQTRKGKHTENGAASSPWGGAVLSSSAPSMAEIQLEEQKSKSTCTSFSSSFDAGSCWKVADVNNISFLAIQLQEEHEEQVNQSVRSDAKHTPETAPSSTKSGKHATDRRDEANTAKGDEGQTNGKKDKIRTGKGKGKGKVKGKGKDGRAVQVSHHSKPKQTNAQSCDQNAIERNVSKPAPTKENRHSKGARHTPRPSDHKAMARSTAGHTNLSVDAPSFEPS